MKPPLRAALTCSGEAIWTSSSRVFLGEDEQLPDDRPQKRMLVMAFRDRGPLVDDNLVTTGPTAVDAGIGDGLSRLIVLVEGPRIGLNEAVRIFVLCHPASLGSMPLVGARLPKTSDQTVI
jgi:hypothetical protein